MTAYEFASIISREVEAYPFASPTRAESIVTIALRGAGNFAWQEMRFNREQFFLDCGLNADGTYNYGNLADAVPA